jgi:DNA-binding MarR family transcriptional regulator
MLYSELSDIIFDTIKKVIFPEEWLKIDLSLSKHEIFALMIVDRRGEIIMSQIADYVNIPMSTATGIVDRLVKNGYLERNRSESDRRIVIIKLTTKAKELVNEIKNVGSKYFSMINEALTDEERTVLTRLITKIISIINKKNELSPGTGDTETQIAKINIE